jgi:TonB family protein
LSPSIPSSRRRRRRPALTTLTAVVLALLFHVGVVGLLLLANFVSVKWPGGDRQRSKPQAVTLRNLDPRAWAKNRGQIREREAPEQQRRAEAKKPEPKDEKNPRGQVVDVAPGNEQESPDAKYLAEKNNRVDKESKAREQTPFYRNAMPRQTATEERKTTGKDEAAQLVVQGNNGTGQDARPAQKGGGQKPVFDVPSLKQRDRIALKEQPNKGPGATVRNQGESAPLEGNSNRLRIDPGKPGEEGDQGSSGKAGLPTLSQLMPSSAALDKIIGAAPNDHLQDIEQGAGTFLNTREWKYATFFNRVKQAVGRNWDPNEPLRQRDPTGEIYGGRDRYTILDVTLGGDGLVKDIKVQRSSGVDFLDEAAIVSFRRAQPFPNPPPGLMGKDGTVTFPFGFYLETSGRPLMRIFRNN